MDIAVLTNALAVAGADEADGDNGLAMAVYGRAYEYIYTKKDETFLMIKNLAPEQTFIVRDDSIEGEQALLESPTPHYMQEVPVIEYLNNKLGIGDFELQIPLIDAYNALMSDRVTDKEQFIDAILAIYGTLLADSGNDDRRGENGSVMAMKRLRQEKLLEMPAASKAEYLTRTFDESGVEILKKALEQDIHKFSNIPCLTDEAFGGNVSGVAMEFKLLGLENVTKIKSRYYTKGICKRLRIFVKWLNTSKGIMIDPSAITPVFTRALPKNLLEISQMVSNLWGKVSRKTLLSQIPFIENPDAELAVVEKEEQDSLRQQQEIFGLGSNTPPEEKNNDIKSHVDTVHATGDRNDGMTKR